MAISYKDDNEKLRRIVISGRLDIPGTEQIDAELSALTASTDRRVIVDLCSVSFLASVGIRSLMVSAKAMQQRGGRMVLFVGDNVAVARTLQTTGVDALIPMFDDGLAATNAALA